MGVKTERFDTEKHADILDLPTTSSKSRTQSSAGFSRLRRVVVAFGLIYLLFSWIPFRGDTDLHAQLFSKPRILNGKPAEKIFLKVPNPEGISAAHKKYAKLAHVAGSEQDLITAKIVLDSFYESFGLSRSSDNLIYDAGSTESQSAIYDFSSKDSPRAWIDTYYSLLDTPHKQSLETVDEIGNVLWTAELQEVCDPLDEDANNACFAVPSFHGFSADGDVYGELVYGNYGDPEDYDGLERRGIDVTGKIMLVRYGSNMRGLKVQNAEERGAVGVLIYSDIRDDGGITEENGFLPYPKGPARNPFMIQRGSVQFVPVYPGDPTTPGVPSYKNSTRVKDTNIPSIPSLPLSWENSKYLRSELNRTGTVRLHLVNKIEREIKPIWNTMMLIPGIITDEVVVVGNHRDAWVLGAVDPSSGSACLDEVIHGFGELSKSGWKPLRTILLASWDAEEYGLIGSTEWGEDFAGWISKNVVTYLNMDSSASGSRWGAAASPSLFYFIRQLAHDIPHPTRENATLWDCQSDLGPFVTSDINMTREEPSSDDGYVFPLGSGSDFTVFLQRIGVASADATFVNAPGDAVYPYHSIYDSIPFVEKFIDPGYHRFTTMAKYLGLESLRLADAIVLPINTSHYALELTSYTKLVAAAAKERNIAVDLSPLDKAISDLRDATGKFEKEKIKAKKALLKSLKRWHRRHSILDRLCRLVKRWFGCDKNEEEIEINYEAMTTHFFQSGGHTSVPRYVKRAIKRVREINSILMSFESGFISEEGLPGRTWYRHFGVAPGKRLGYGATTFPALTESITLDRNATSARVEVERLSEMIKKLAKQI